MYEVFINNDSAYVANSMNDADTFIMNNTTSDDSWCIQDINTGEIISYAQA